LGYETISYLLGGGFSLRFVKDFLETSRDIVVAGLGDTPVDSTKVFFALSSQLCCRAGKLRWNMSHDATQVSALVISFSLPDTGHNLASAGVILLPKKNLPNRLIH
jgi:hypothetical protein